MRIDQTSNTAVRPLSIPTAPVQSITRRGRLSDVSADSGRAPSDSFVRHQAAADTISERRLDAMSPAPSEAVSAPAAAAASAELREQPRFSVLVDLMERLTGREIKLLPPATIMLGQRKQPTGPAEVAPPASNPAQIDRVTPMSNGEVFRIDTSVDLGDGSTATARFDVGMDVIRDHGSGADAGAGPLAVRVSADAAQSSSSQPLVLKSAGADAVVVTARDV